MFAEHGVSIETVRQQQLPPLDGVAGLRRMRRVQRRHAPGSADAPGSVGRAALVVVTHTAPDAALSATVEALADLDIVAAVASVMRVEGES